MRAAKDYGKYIKNNVAPDCKTFITQQERTCEPVILKKD